jgi:hypothetical protein
MRTVVSAFFIFVFVPNCHLRADSPLASLNRYIGLGWGDGYHAAWTGCPGQCGGMYGESCQPSPVNNSQPTAVPEKTTGTPEGTTGRPRSELFNSPTALARPVRLPPVESVPLWQPPTSVAVPRLVRLPAPEAEVEPIARRPIRLPPTSQRF